MKVLLKNGYGDFSLSSEARQWLIEHNAMDLFVVQTPKELFYNSLPPELQIDSSETWEGDYEEYISSNGKDELYFYRLSDTLLSVDYDLLYDEKEKLFYTFKESLPQKEELKLRSNTLLLECFEKFQDKFFNNDSKGRITEIPDGIEVYVGGDRLSEEVHEVHRIWK